MNTRGLLDQLLKSGQQLLEKQAGGAKTGAGAGGLGGLLSGAGGGLLGGGALGVLLGSKKARKFGGKALTYGGLSRAWRACLQGLCNWQAQQANQQTPHPRAPDGRRVPAAQVEQHSQAVLRALVAAAKADGHVDERERALIEGEFTRLDGDREVQQWLHAELDKPLDPAEVARAAQTPEIAAEMYLASVMMVDQENYMERAYLDELARQLGLAQGLREELEKQARQV
ncbi:tellurite resistance TerB family protein [Pseudomonas sp. SWI7]|nr:tellurite resistance TerB family protein [Pseudomonas sp. SWI7]